ncbi:hypothetical protein TrispH2_012008, partial [Trichoplax sp. H2]
MFSIPDGILVGLAEKLPDTPFLTEEEIPALNSYRIYPQTRKWNLKFIGRQNPVKMKHDDQGPGELNEILRKCRDRICLSPSISLGFFL